MIEPMKEGIPETGIPSLTKKNRFSASSKEDNSCILTNYPKLVECAVSAKTDINSGEAFRDDSAGNLTSSMTK